MKSKVVWEVAIGNTDDEEWFWEGHVKGEKITSIAAEHFHTKNEAIKHFFKFAKLALKPGSWRIVKP